MRRDAADAMAGRRARRHGGQQRRRDAVAAVRRESADRGDVERWAWEVGGGREQAAADAADEGWCGSVGLGV